MTRTVNVTILRRTAGVVLWVLALLLAVTVVAPAAVVPAALIWAAEWLLGNE